MFFLTLGLILIGYVGYNYLGPDLAYDLQQIANGLTGLAASGSPIAGSGAAFQSALQLPYPRGKGQEPNRLVVPRMKLDTGVKEAPWKTTTQSGNLYTDWVLPYDAAGHLSTTANPGEAGNVVISGHNNLVGPDQFGVGLFAGLWNLQPGDDVYVLDTAGRAFEYQVTKSFHLKEEGEPESVRLQHAQQILADDGSPVLTLLTCWNGPVAPLSGNTYRWIVTANLVGQVDPGQVPAFSN